MKTSKLKYWTGLITPMHGDHNTAHQKTRQTATHPHLAEDTIMSPDHHQIIFTIKTRLAFLLYNNLVFLKRRSDLRR